jgi:hypothetical protein
MTLPTRNSIGLLKRLAKEDDGMGFKTGRNHRIAIAPNIAITPPSLLVMDLRMA